MADFILDTLRGGFDDFTPVSSQQKDICTIADNVEFFLSTLGERRAGTAAFNTPAGISGDALLSAAVWMFVHTPTKNESENELWVLTADSDNTPKMYRYTRAGGWSTVAFYSANDTPIITNDDGSRVYGQSLHGKLFISFKSLNDRIHVWDGITASLRPVGLAAHAAAPTAVGVGSGTMNATRYYRTRSVERSGVVVLRRSEPSAVLNFNASAGYASITVTRPTAVGEAETDWELEVSLDNLVFYKVATIAIATTTYSDTTIATAYSSGALSDPIGSYALIPSVKYLLAVDDRLLLGSSWTTASDGSAVQWTPVGNDPLPGPDERLNLTTDPRIDLDGRQGGDITAMGHAEVAVLVGKVGHFYQLLRTGLLVGAYSADQLSNVIGALPRSMVESVDENGRPTLYWLDPKTGPFRYGPQQMQACGIDLHTTWKLVNPNAAVPCHGVYYADKFQVHYWLATQTSMSDLTARNYPNRKIVLQTNLTQPDGEGGVRGGWSHVPLQPDLTPVGIADARCSVMVVPALVGTLVPRAVPFIGKAIWLNGDVSTNRNVLQVCDVGSTDEGPVGATAYVGKARSRAFFLAQLPNRFGILNGSILGLAGSRVRITLVRDYGKELLSVDVDLTAAGAETHVIKTIDQLSMAEIFALSVQFEDDPAHITQWQLFYLVLNESKEQIA